MKLCETCRYGNEYEMDKPCIVYREDCPMYQKEGDGMTNEKAIEELKGIKSAYSNKQQFHEACLMRSEIEALDMAIKALEQEPSCPFYKIDDDGHGLCTNHRYIPTMYYPQVEGITPTVVCEVTTSQEPSGETVSLETFKQVMWERDIAIGQLKELGYGFGQKIEPCDDAINRQAAIEAFKPRGIAEDVWQECHEYKVLKSLPPVNPQEPKTWHWIGIDEEPHEVWECDHCGFVIDGSGCIDPYDYRDTYKFCPNCGAKMVEPQESDHKCHTCKHYTSGEYDGSCDSYVCEHYSGWESEDEE